MKSRVSGYAHYFSNLICPAVVFGSITGVLTAAVISIYKYCAGVVIHWSEGLYETVGSQYLYIPILLVCFAGFSVLLEMFYKKAPHLKGGGIPASIGMLRGLIPVKWFVNLVGMFFVSLFSFFIGVPLGNEGPSVQMGTLIGRGALAPFAKKHKAWSRYSMTGGACAGFSVATGSPISGIIFAVEEAHQSVSPMILIVSSIAVATAHISAELLAPVFGISVRLFPELSLPELSLGEYWIPLVAGLAVGAFAVVFLKYYTFVSFIVRRKLSKLAPKYKFFSVFALTMVLGLVSPAFVSTGHHLVEELMEASPSWILLLAILLFRTTLTFSANSSGISGGLFLPIMALGATLASLLGKGLLFCGLDESYYTIIVVLGISACVSGMMKTPFTAIVFSIEVLSMGQNILPIIISVAAAYIVTEVFSAVSISDIAMENVVEEYRKGKNLRVYDTRVEVKAGAFAAGKQIRDIFWPGNLFVLSVKHKDEDAEIDAHGGKVLSAGDVLHIRYSTFESTVTKEEILSIVGEQEFDETVDDNI